VSSGSPGLRGNRHAECRKARSIKQRAIAADSGDASARVSGPRRRAGADTTEATTHTRLKGARPLACNLRHRRPGARPADAWKEERVAASKEEIAVFIAAEFPHMKVAIREVGDRRATVLHEIGQTELRPGGTVAGPVLMAVADLALYAAILGDIGIVPLTVTTSLTINFLRKPSADRHIVAECKLMKRGRSLAVGEVWLYSEGTEDPVAHVVGTYSIPPNARR
jgi:acyl-coenzyme A thioesterase PaaI-like protein